MKFYNSIRRRWVICIWCKRYFKQLEFLHRASPCLDEHLAAFAQRSLTAEAKGRIVTRLRGAL